MLKVALVQVQAVELEAAQEVGLEAAQAVDRGHLVRYLIIRLSVIRYLASAV